MRVLETRTTPDGFKRRRYESASGLRHTTIEIPINLWEQINKQGRHRNRAAAIQRKRERNSLRWQACGLVQSGRAKREVARLLSIPESTVRRWVS